ncbi:hypothetical protein PT974_01646 [Cladobotryum mycophilum]|uniref:YhhN-like protein n=1 Tax=Cladobotryum mycophilum TaxID=491253 RepID=A0ABR0T4B2_9HYPO
MSFVSIAETPLHNALLCISIAAAVFYGFMIRERPASSRRTVAKTLATALLSATVALRDGPPLLMTALALGAAGDAFLAWEDMLESSSKRKPNSNSETDTAFLYGLCSFLVSHICYASLFFQNHSGLTNFLSDLWRSTLALGILILGPVMVFVLTPRVGQHLRLPVMGYAIAILAMVLTALPLKSSRVVAGGIMFAVSDAILSADKFLLTSTSSLRVGLQYAVWVLYYSAQLLISVGVLNSI